jgi:signal transduction histidine kinase
VCARARHPHLTKVLIVDNQDEAVRALESTLEGAGRQVIHARSADEALDRVSDEQVDAILLDPESFAKLLKARRRAEDHTRDRDEFLLIASHELNTPLTALQLQLQRIERALARGEGQEQIADSLQVAQRSTRRLSELMQRLLDASQLSDGRLELEREPVDLSALTREVIARFSGEAAQVGSTLTLCAPEPSWGKWDRARLDQILTHLTSNAIKYGRGRPIAFTVDGDPTVARFTIRDLGIGIAPLDRERIFERFARAVSGRNFGGLGLGLYIVGQIVAAHQGRIDVASRLGEGATFTVALPRQVP